MARKTVKKAAKRVVKSERPQRLLCGDFFITRLSNGELWMLNYEGEAMPVNETQLNQTLRRFFARHF